MDRSERRRKSSGRQALAWALYDFANSPFTTLVVTFVYSTYFTQVIAPDAMRGTVWWSRAVTVSALAVAVASPVLGALADRGGYRKLFLLVFTGTCITATVALYPVLPGQMMAALTCFVLANISFELANVFYNAFLPDIATPERIGRISGFGWALGYVGGLLALVVALVTLVSPDLPWFGFSKAQGENVRATTLLVAAWFAVFSVPILLWVKEDRSAVSRPGRIVADTVSQLSGTLRKLREHRQVVRLLLARLVYNDGLVTVFAFGGIYAAETFGFSMEEVISFGIALNVAAGIGAFGLGFLDDLLGGKRTIQITLVGLTLSTVAAVLASGKVWLWIAGVGIGLFVGPNQSASRSLMGRFVPSEAENEFFGFFALSGKLTAFVGPLLLGLLTEAFGSQRAGVAVVIGLFFVGLVLVSFVNEREGVRSAQRATPAA